MELKQLEQLKFMKTIKGYVKYQAIGVGFWGIISDEGQRWIPTNLPPELQKEDLYIELRMMPTKDNVSIFMWGTPVKVASYRI